MVPVIFDDMLLGMSVGVTLQVLDIVLSGLLGETSAGHLSPVVKFVIRSFYRNHVCRVGSLVFFRRCILQNISGES